VSTLSDLVYAQGRSTGADVEWLHRLAGDGQLLADLAFADIVIWVPTVDDSFIAVAHTRPSGAATLFYRDIVGDMVRPQWRTQVRDAFTRVEIVDSASPDWFEETPTRVRAVPIVRAAAPVSSRPWWWACSRGTPTSARRARRHVSRSPSTTAPTTCSA
jgi:hypothetical protein